MSSESEERWVVAGPLSLAIDPSLAGRVTQLCHRDRNLLGTTSDNPTNWGATYWTSPQSDWGWPPISAVDSLPYEILQASTALRLLSSVARLDEREFQIEKEFAVGPHEGTIDAVYTIHNCGPVEFSMANWEISRVQPGGLTFYPTGHQELTPIAPHGALVTEKSFATTFFDHARFERGRSLKLHADGKGGYLAHVCDDLLMLKLFRDSEVSEQAPGEGECEIFANEDGKYVEIEVQGSYRLVPCGGQHSTKIRTVVVELPEDLPRGDREGLRRFADQQAARYCRGLETQQHV